MDIKTNGWNKVFFQRYWTTKIIKESNQANHKQTPLTLKKEGYKRTQKPHTARGKRSQWEECSRSSQIIEEHTKDLCFEHLN